MFWKNKQILISLTKKSFEKAHKLFQNTSLNFFTNYQEKLSQNLININLEKQKVRSKKNHDLFIHDLISLIEFKFDL